MKITKVELLWSRACPFRCAGCTMPNSLRVAEPVKHQGNLADWLRGVQKMADLGSQFVAIYGAEPLTRMKYLPEVINHIYSRGMKATVITALPLAKQLPTLLESCDLDSVTCSYDALEGSGLLDPARRAKSLSSKIFLEHSPGLRDRAVVMTVSRENGDEALLIAEKVLQQDAWFLFDLYHPGTGPASKCGNDDGGDHAPTIEQVRKLTAELLFWKEMGRKVHASREYLLYLGQRYTGVVRETWHCYGSPVGWITVDADGSIFPCDDWQLTYPAGKIWDDTWTPDELETWCKTAVKNCPGCSWNTHFDACAIEGGADIGTYVH